MKADAWMPFYVADYLRKTMRLTTEQHGAYFLLIMACWTEGGSIPDDDAQLAAIVKLPTQAWKKSRLILAPYFIIGDGLWGHKRVAEELARAQKLSDARRESGSKGGRPTKVIESKEKPIGLANENQSGLQTETPALVAPPSPLPLPSEVPPTTSANAFDWQVAIEEARGAIGDMGDFSQPAMLHIADLKAFLFPTSGEPCTWQEILDGIRVCGSRQRIKNKPIPSWQWVKNDVMAMRDKRLNASNPNVIELQPRSQSLTDRISADHAEARRRVLEEG